MVKCEDYAKFAETTDVSPRTIEYYTISLAGEVGEVCDQVKKLMRDDKFKLTPDRRNTLLDELGDVAWYFFRLCDKLGLDVEQDILEWNHIKLQVRKKEGKIHGR